MGGPRLLKLTGLDIDGGSPTLDPVAAGYVTPPPVAEPVVGELDWLPAGPTPPLDGGELAARLAAVPTAGIGQVAYQVIDPWSGQVLVDVDGGRPLVPASNMKLLTAAAALATFGPEHRFSTRLVGGDGHLILVGGGDPYLSATTTDYPARASLADLAALAAPALTAAGISQVQLDWDASYFAGATWHPSWPAGDIAYVGPTSALWADRGWSGGSHHDDPAAAAAEVFAGQLRQLGIEVILGRAVTAPAGAALVAEVESLPLSLIVQETLLQSDNDTAEVLFRQVSRGRGGDGSITSARQEMTAVLTELGVWQDGMVIDDGSGMSEANRVTAGAIAGTVRLGFGEARYRSLLSGLPTAGSDGSLGSGRRYDDEAELPGRGYVRAKTGTLTGVHCLGGMAQTRSGAVVAFAFFSNDTWDDQAAVDWLDTITAVLSQS